MLPYPLLLLQTLLWAPTESSSTQLALKHYAAASALSILWHSWTVVHRSALVSYNAGISACEKCKQWQRALALLSEMCEAKLEPDVICILYYNSGRSACEKEK